MKVGHVTERTGENGAPGGPGQMDTDEMDRAGIDLGATGRLQLMAKLAEGIFALLRCISFLKRFSWKENDLFGYFFVAIQPCFIFFLKNKGA